MIGMTIQGIGRFLNNPLDTMVDMRATAPSVLACTYVLLAATLVMVVVDFAYAPYAFPQSMLTDGSREFGIFAVAAVEIMRVFSVSAIILIGVRYGLKEHVSVADALWMTAPFAVALVVFELLQCASFLIALSTGLNLYALTAMVGFGGVMLVLAVSIRALAPDQDWLSALLIAICALVVGFYAAPLVLMGMAIYLMVREKC